MKDILIIDDDKELLKMLELKLCQSKYEFQFESDPLEVLDVVKDKIFDLLIIDIHMPEMDGFALLSTLKSYNYTMPVMFFSSDINYSSLRHALEMGAVDFIKKPVTKSTIINAIEKFHKEITSEESSLL